MQLQHLGTETAYFLHLVTLIVYFYNIILNACFCSFKINEFPFTQKTQRF